MRDRTPILITAATLALAAPALACGGYGWPPAIPEASEPPVVELAICLDTSGSMENLIDAAKQHLWAVVNDLALARPQPRLRVALLTYGNDGYAAEDGWVRVDTDLTEDLDRVSERLFALRTNGGTELVGRALRRAHDALSWTGGDDSLRLVVVAGNESADQDAAAPFADACAALVADGVLVNSIFCGPAAHADVPGWREVAARADGHFAAFDHRQGPLVVESPHDAALQRLSTRLNETYVPVGAAGRAGAANQVAQDCNAAGMNGAAAASRAQSKAGGAYWCSWDLVDRLAREPDLDLSLIDAADLPEPLRDLDADALRARVRELAAERASLQAQISELSRRRAEHVSRETARLRAAGALDFEAALLTAIRHQARARGFVFEPLGGARAAEASAAGVE